LSPLTLLLYGLALAGGILACGLAGVLVWAFRLWLLGVSGAEKR
jgi:hypothetical protein